MFLFTLGFVTGAVVMYLVLRKNPKIKTEVDQSVQEIKSDIEKKV